MPIVMLVEYTPLEGKKDDLLAALTESVGETHKEDGCVKFAFHSTKDKVFLIEVWRDKEALAAHAEGLKTKPPSKAREFMDGAPNIMPIRPAPAGDPDKGVIWPTKGSEILDA